LVVIEKERRQSWISDIAIRDENRVVERKQEKVDEYPDLKHEMARQWELRKEEVILVFVGALGMVTN